MLYFKNNFRSNEKHLFSCIKCEYNYILKNFKIILVSVIVLKMDLLPFPKWSNKFLF